MLKITDETELKVLDGDETKTIRRFSVADTAKKTVLSTTTYEVGAAELAAEAIGKLVAPLGFDVAEQIADKIEEIEKAVRAGECADDALAILQECIRETAWSKLTPRQRMKRLKAEFAKLGEDPASLASRAAAYETDAD